jgi:hypothetical protein
MPCLPGDKRCVEYPVVQINQTPQKGIYGEALHKSKALSIGHECLKKIKLEGFVVRIWRISEPDVSDDESMGWVFELNKGPIHVIPILGNGWENNIGLNEIAFACIIGSEMNSEVGFRPEIQIGNSGLLYSADPNDAIKRARKNMRDTFHFSAIAYLEAIKIKRKQ